MRSCGDEGGQARAQTAEEVLLRELDSTSSSFLLRWRRSTLVSLQMKAGRRKLAEIQGDSRRRRRCPRGRHHIRWGRRTNGGSKEIMCEAATPPHPPTARYGAVVPVR